MAIQGIYTTLNNIRQHDPCTNGWEKLLKSLNKTKPDDEPLPLESILNSNGLLDAVWALRCIPNTKRICVQYACFCAELVLHRYEKEYPNDNRPRKAIEAARSSAADAVHAVHAVRAAYAAADAVHAVHAVHAVRAAVRAADAAVRAAKTDSNIKHTLIEEFLRICRLEPPYTIDSKQYNLKEQTNVTYNAE